MVVFPKKGDYEKVKYSGLRNCDGNGWKTEKSMVKDFFITTHQKWNFCTLAPSFSSVTLRPIRFVSLALPWHTVLSIIPDVKTYNHTIILFFCTIRIQVYRFFNISCFHFISILLSHSSALCRQISLPVAHQLWVYLDANNGTLTCWNHATFQPMLIIQLEADDFRILSRIVQVKNP